MLLEQVTYSRKAGLPDYGSVGLSLTAELESGDNLAAVFGELRRLVDSQVNTVLKVEGTVNGSHPAASVAPPQAEPFPSGSSSNGAVKQVKNPTAPPTERQIALINQLAKSKGIESVPLEGLDRAAASKLIDDLQNF